jgi:RNA-directed DNA polymerase
MKEQHRQGLASQSDPEPCGGVREDAAEASVGASAGQVLSREISSSGVSTPFWSAEDNTGRERSGEFPVDPTRSETLHMRRNSARENRETSLLPFPDGGDGRVGKADGLKPTMHGGEESDGPIVPTKRPNKAGRPAAEGVEGRGPTKENSTEQNVPRTQRRTRTPSALDRVRRKARQDRKARFTALLHHVTLDRLRAAYRRIQRRAAPGVDGMTWAQYGEDLEDNLRELHARLHRGAYRAKPSRRVYIPKADGRQRPLGIATLEDKVVQAAVVEVMNAIYEQDFLGFSYGFRPGRSAHQALDALAVGLWRKKVNWVLDADIRSFFDTIDHGWLRKFLEHRIGDRRILRLIQKWLAAGVMEKGVWAASERGAPQGATISPLLANLYLHYVLDLWANQWRRRYARGDVILVRYADDFVLGFEFREDAERFLEDLRGRLRKFSLELHPKKTRLIEFGRFAASSRRARGLRGAPETFAFLGFRHICGRTRRGDYLLTRHTDSKRLRARLHEVKTELRWRMHDSIPQQGAWLRRVVQGYNAYHAVPTNTRALAAFRRLVTRAWLCALRRRSQRDRTSWTRITQLCDRWLPRPRVLHPWPSQRFDASIQGRSPVR